MARPQFDRTRNMELTASCQSIFRRLSNLGWSENHGTAGVSPQQAAGTAVVRLGRVAGIGRQAGALDAAHGADLVLVRGAAAAPDRSADPARRCTNPAADRRRPAGAW